MVTILYCISVYIDVYLQENSQRVSRGDTDCDETMTIDCGDLQSLEKGRAGVSHEGPFVRHLGGLNSLGEKG